MSENGTVTAEENVKVTDDANYRKAVRRQQKTFRIFLITQLKKREP